MFLFGKETMFELTFKRSTDLVSMVMYLDPSVVSVWSANSNNLMQKNDEKLKSIERQLLRLFFKSAAASQT